MSTKNKNDRDLKGSDSEGQSDNAEATQKAASKAKKATVDELGDDDLEEAAGGLSLTASTGDDTVAVEQYRKIVEHGNPIYSTRDIVS